MSRLVFFMWMFRYLSNICWKHWFPSWKSSWQLFQSVQSFSHIWLFVTPWTAACQAAVPITNPQSLLKLTSIESVMPSNHLILSSSPFPPVFSLSQDLSIFWHCLFWCILGLSILSHWSIFLFFCNTLCLDNWGSAVWY